MNRPNPQLVFDPQERHPIAAGVGPQVLSCLGGSHLWQSAVDTGIALATLISKFHQIRQCIPNPKARRRVKGVKAKAGQESWAYRVRKGPINQRYSGHP